MCIWHNLASIPLWWLFGLFPVFSFIRLVIKSATLSILAHVSWSISWVDSLKGFIGCVNEYSAWQDNCKQLIRSHWSSSSPAPWCFHEPRLYLLLLCSCHLSFLFSSPQWGTIYTYSIGKHLCVGEVGINTCQPWKGLNQNLHLKHPPLPRTWDQFWSKKRNITNPWKINHQPTIGLELSQSWTQSLRLLFACHLLQLFCSTIVEFPGNGYIEFLLWNLSLSTHRSFPYIRFSLIICHLDCGLYALLLFLPNLFTQ